MDDELDPTLVDRFRLLTDLPVPDTWARVATPQQTGGPDSPVNDGSPVSHGGPGADRVHLLGTAAPRRGHTPLLAVAAAFAVVGISLGAVWYGLQPDADRLEVSTPTATTESPATPDTSPPTPEAKPSDCTEELAHSLRQGLPDDYPPADHTAPRSLAELVRAGERIVRGQILMASPENGGSRILIKTRDSFPTETGAIVPDGAPEPVPAFWTPAAQPPDQLFLGSLVAVLSNERRGGIPVVQPEGLWVSCDDTSPAVSVLATPTGPGWEPVLTPAPSLEHLWDQLLAAVVVDRPLGAPSTLEPGAVVYDLRLTTGERFRLRLPEALAGDYTIIDDPSGPTVTLTGPADITIAFGGCDRWDQAWTENDHGSFVTIEDGVARACRIGSLVEMRLSGVDVANSTLRDEVDLRPLADGRRSQPTLDELLDGRPTGPRSYSDQGVIVTTSGYGRIDGVDAVTLAEVWRFRPLPAPSEYLVDDSGNLQPLRYSTLFLGSTLIFSSSDERLVALDPASGTEQWELVLPGETLLGVVEVGSGDPLLWSNAEAGPVPVLRRVEGATGVTIWKAEGRANTAASSLPPMLIDDVVILLDAPELPTGGANPAAGAVLGFSRDGGELLWTLDLREASGLADVATSVDWVDVEDGRAVLVSTRNANLLRIDHRTGEVLWTAERAGQVTGTDIAPNGSLAISLDNPSTGDILIDPDTGRRIPR